MAATELIAPHPFGKYTLVAKLGRGGMAEVYLGVATGPQGFRKPVVIKKILSNLASETRLVQMFFDEARLAARLQHPNVVQTYEVGEVDGSVFLAMEYLEGHTLSEVIRASLRAGARVPLAYATYAALEALEGLHHAHDLRDFQGNFLGVVHRDVSPQNIFITYDGAVKVLDFGVAKAATQVVETRAGSIKGKYAYMSPEQGRGQNVDRRCDIWSLGVVLWETLVGRRLFKGANEFETMRLVMEAPIPPLEEYLTGVPAGLSRAVARALSREVADRHPDALAMHDELLQVLRGFTQPTGRAEIRDYMRQLFGDYIEERRQTIGQAIAAVGPAPEVTSVDFDEDLAPITVTEQLLDPDTGPDTVVSADPSLTARPAVRWLGAAVGLLVASMAVGVLAWMFHDSSSSATEPPQVVTARNSPEPVEEPRPVAEPAAPPEQGVVEDGDPQPTSEALAESESEEVTPASTSRNPTSSDVVRDRREATLPTGTLTLDTVPWSQVYLSGRLLGTTPLIEVTLPEGVHVLTLVNPERDLRSTYRVRIVGGEQVSRRVAID